MTFIPEPVLEQRAAELWQQHRLEPDSIRSGSWTASGSALSGRRYLTTGVGFLVISDQRVVVLNERHLDALEEKDGRLGRYTIWHEVSHWELHAGAARSGTLSLLPGGRTWCRDGSPDPVERQADMFSAALLIPRDRLRVALPKRWWGGWRTIYDLADLFVVNVTPIRIRLERLGWMYLNEDRVPVSGPRPPSGQGQPFAG